MPWSRAGVIGGIMLGWARAGRNDGRDFRDRQCASDQRFLIGPSTTISASIANEFAEARRDLYTSSLFALGLLSSSSPSRSCRRPPAAHAPGSNAVRRV